MPVALAYPYGNSNDATRQAMQAVGLQIGFDSFNNFCLNPSLAATISRICRALR